MLHIAGWSLLAVSCEPALPDDNIPPTRSVPETGVTQELIVTNQLVERGVYI